MGQLANASNFLVKKKKTNKQEATVDDDNLMSDDVLGRKCNERMSLLQF